MPHGKEFEPHAAVQRQQIAAHGVEVHPEIRVDAPLECSERLHFFAPLAHEARRDAHHILHAAVLRADGVAVAFEREAVALAAHEAMQHVNAFRHLCQYHIAGFQGVGSKGRKHHLVAQVLKVGAHAVTLDAERGGLSGINGALDFTHEYVIGEGLYRHNVRFSTDVFSPWQSSSKLDFAHLA